jgi:DNA-directed RNA polymerase specialized sigma24 family protein
MKHDTRHLLSMNDGEPGTAPQFPFYERSSSLSPTGESPLTTLRVPALIEQSQREIQLYRHGEPCNERFGLELLRRAMVQGDQAAWTGFQQCFGELVLDWLRWHPRREAACHLEREETYVARAFERFWQASVQQQRVFRTLEETLAYLRASLHGGILDRLRTSSRPGEASLPEPAQAGKPSVEERAASLQLWQVLQSLLPDAREQRLAYLLYHCGLLPREIVRYCPREWNDVQEIYRLRRNILERLLLNANQCTQGRGK